MHRHHIIPVHAGGTDEELNMTPPISIALHAEFHRDRWLHTGNELDKLAWRMLSGRITKEEARIEAPRIGRRAKPFTDEHRAKLRAARARQVRGPHSAETRAKMSAAAIRVAASDDERRRRSDRAKAQHVAGNLGRKFWKRGI